MKLEYHHQERNLEQELEKGFIVSSSLLLVFLVGDSRSPRFSLFLSVVLSILFSLSHSLSLTHSLSLSLSHTLSLSLSPTLFFFLSQTHIRTLNKGKSQRWAMGITGLDCGRVRFGIFWTKKFLKRNSKATTSPDIPCLCVCESELAGITFPFSRVILKWRHNVIAMAFVQHSVCSGNKASWFWAFLQFFVRTLDWSSLESYYVIQK